MVHNNWVFGKENKLRRFEEAKLGSSPEAVQQQAAACV